MKFALALVVCLFVAGVGCAADRDANLTNKFVPGGWSPVAVDDARVKIAAEQAVAARVQASGTQLTLASIEAAQRQVVAGMNYKLRLSVMNGDQRQLANAAVWAKLNGAYELTAWSWE